jgi:hypothetical protein
MHRGPSVGALLGKGVGARDMEGANKTPLGESVCFTVGMNDDDGCKLGAALAPGIVGCDEVVGAVVFEATVGPLEMDGAGLVVGPVGC